MSLLLRKCYLRRVLEKGPSAVLCNWAAFRRVVIFQACEPTYSPPPKKIILFGVKE
jgi:hypothetical protein